MKFNSGGDFMKILRIILLSVLSILVAIYLAFLFILPNVVDLSSYSAPIKKAVEEASGVKVQIDGFKVQTAWNLSVGALIDKTDLKYQNGKKFAQINGLQIRLSLVPLFFNEFKINKINADKILLNLDIDKNGKFLLDKKSAQKQNSKFKFSNHMPDIIVKKYRISLIKGEKIYSAKGTDLKIYDFVLNKRIKLKTKGDLIFNSRKQISYDIRLFSKVFLSKKSQKLDLIKIFDDLYKYNVHANVDTDLIIKNEQDTDGRVKLDRIFFTMGEKILPQSDLRLDFKGNKVKINSNLYADTNSKAVISGFFKDGKHKEIDLKVVTNRVNLTNAVFVANNILKIFGKKNLDKIDASGYLTANFAIKSNFKNIRSSGYLKLADANLTNKIYNLSLRSINADVDFSQDAVNIKKATALFNSQPIIIKGIVDKNANADIIVLADKLPLKGFLFTFGKEKILRENDVLSGLVDIKAIIKGRLDKINPQITLNAADVKINNKKTKTKIIITQIMINSNSAKKLQGDVKLTGLKMVNPTGINIFAPNISMDFSSKDLDIKPTYLYLNNIKTNLGGKISGLSSSAYFNPVMISIPNQISVPIKGYPGSNILAKGNLKFVGDLYAPKIQGLLNFPLIQIPTALTVLKNTTLQFGEDSKINCPQIHIANYLMSFNAQLNNNFSQGIVAKNAIFKSKNIDLNILIPIFKKNQTNNQSLNIAILNGKMLVDNFKIGRIDSENIASDFSLKDDILSLNNLYSEAYLGKVVGKGSYDLLNQKTILNLQGRGLSANPSLIALTGENYDINGQLDFDNNISMLGSSKRDLLNTLKGDVNFIITNGRMGVLGKFEHLLYAQNIISNNFFKASLNLIAKAITAKNTGVYKYMKGQITFSDGWANINRVKTSGPSMSLYITGKCHMAENKASLTILGRISDDVVKVLGPIGEFSMDKVISFIPKIGEITTFVLSQFSTNPTYENISEIPYLTPKTELPTKEFKVIIDGEIQKQSSVKSFKWLARPKVLQKQSNTYISPSKQIISVPDFVKNLPDLQN